MDSRGSNNKPISNKPKNKRPRSIDAAMKPSSSNANNNNDTSMTNNTSSISTTKKKSKTGNNNKKKDKNKGRSDGNNLRGSSSNHHSSTSATSSIPLTSTADGQRMTQILSTFSKLEQSRFAAFQQSALNATAVETWLGVCLSDRLLLPSQDRRPLADFCVPGQDQDIVMVVATLAKIYAQRLVATACQLRRDDPQGDDAVKEESSSGSSPDKAGFASNSTTRQNSPQRPLQPRDILRALEHRQKQGLDPGLFLQAQPAVHYHPHGSAAADDASARLAALAAEQAYDAMMEERRRQAMKEEMDVEQPSPVKADADRLPNNVQEPDAHESSTVMGTVLKPEANKL